MSLYLTVFEHDAEHVGWVLGHYSDFAYFRNVIAVKLDAKRYPLFLNHSDCDGEWTVAELPDLRREIRTIAEYFKELPPEEPIGAFEHTAGFRRNAKCLYDCFHNVDGENLFEAIVALCGEGERVNRAILLQ